MIKKPENFTDLLELQKKLDETVYQERESGFKPRQRTEFDLRMALDDEFNEFMKELPAEINFKTWKEIKHDPKKQLEEFVDCLFFMLGAVNDFKEDWTEYKLNDLSEEFNKLTDVRKRDLSVDDLEYFKEKLNNSDLRFPFYLRDLIINYFNIARWIGYSKEMILDTYWEKWNINMKRINKDWSITSQN